MSTKRSQSGVREEVAGYSTGQAVPRPRLGVLATHPIQYQAPLYQELSRRAVIDLEVAFLSHEGARPYHDPGFGAVFAWDVDVLGGYRWTLLEQESKVAGGRHWSALRNWLRRQDAVVLHGHANPETLLAAAVCRTMKLPYLLRGESHAEPTATGLRRLARHILASFTVTGAAGALPIGELNAAFYFRYGRIPHFQAPYSVDNDRFGAASEAAQAGRAERLTSLGLDPRRPTAVFAGKLAPRKRPLDAIRAIERCEGEINLLMLGDGALRDQVRQLEDRLPVRCVGFVNQSDLPAWYACGDVLVLPSEREPWGLVVNEAMACGLLPVVSDAVGCAPDLVDGIGEIFPVGNVDLLASALARATRQAPARRDAIRTRLEHYTIAKTAQGYEDAALAVRR